MEKLFQKIKISENSNKVTTPHFKKVYRLYCKKTNKALADLITVYDEEIDETQPLEIFDPVYTWKRKTLVDYYAINLLKPIFKDGKRVYDLPTLEEIRAYCQSQLDTLWDELKRFEFPHKYYVDLSLKLWEIKDQLIKDQAEKYLKG